MIAGTEGLLHQAALVSRGQLNGARGRLSGLNAGEWRAVEELGQRIAETIAIELLDEAERDCRLAAAIAAIFELPEAG